MTIPTTTSHPITDIDGIARSIINQLPMADGEILYKTEIDGQIKVYIGMTIIGILMVLVSILLNIHPFGG